MNKYFQSMGVLGVAWALSACMPNVAKVAPKNETKTFEKRKLELSDITRWHITGGIAVKEGSEGFTASILWRQFAPTSFNIQFSGPLSMGKVVLIKDGNETILKEADKQYSSNDAEALLKTHTGYYIPVNSLFYWVRALPAPLVHADKSLDSFGHVAQLKQQGWLIEYLRFTQFKGLDVPAKIRLTKGNAKVKLIISSWK